MTNTKYKSIKLNSKIYTLPPSNPITPITFPLEWKNGLGRSLDHLKAYIEQGMAGRLTPAFYIASIPCGGGKTTTVVAALQKWKAEGFKGSGVLIAVNTKAEIDAYISACKLDRYDYAVITSDGVMNAYGRGRDDASNARVVFTTHEQYRLQVMEAGTFSACSTFYFGGRPRSLTIWDEGFDFAKPASFNLRALQSLPHTMKGHKALVDAIERLLPDKLSIIAGYAIDIPSNLAELAAAALKDTGVGIDADQSAALKGLGILAGGKGILRDGGAVGCQIVGAGKPLPNDLGAVIVLDASARLVPKYAMAKATGVNIKELPAATIRYPHGTFHWWNVGASKSTMAKTGVAEKIYGAVAALINSRAEEEWLIIFAKAQRSGSETGVPTPLLALLDKPERVHDLTWGHHKAQNKFRHIENVIIIGALNYSESSYAAIAMASSGQREGIVEDETVKAVENGEFASNIYQAVCRTNARNQQDGIGGVFNAYLIMSNVDAREQLVRDAFPGCSIARWEPVPPPKKTKERMAMDVIEQTFTVTSRIKIAELTRLCGGSKPDYLSKVINSARFKKWLNDNGTRRIGNSFIKALYKP